MDGGASAADGVEESGYAIEPDELELDGFDWDDLLTGPEAGSGQSGREEREGPARSRVASVRRAAWARFDRIVAGAAPAGRFSNPWRADGRERRYLPDYETLARLLDVPLTLRPGEVQPSQTGVPALALDVWIAYELRRAGFDPDAVWPRASEPRILPAALVGLLEHLPVQQREAVRERLQRSGPIAGATGSTAHVLGRTTRRQVEVVLSDWTTGPEILVSTKRMDSSYGKNAANRIEEAYGDVRGLRSRHPLAATGFVLGLRSEVLDEPDRFEWLADMLAKLGDGRDAYHATCLVMIEYGEPPAPAALPEAACLGLGPFGEGVAASREVRVRMDLVPRALSAERFFETLIDRVFRSTPVDMHAPARARRRRADGG